MQTKGPFIFLLSLLSMRLYCQSHFGPMKVGIALSFSRNVLYTGIDNDFELNSELPDEKWEVKSSNGSATLWGMNHVKLRPEKPGKDSIQFYFTNEEGERKLGLSVILQVMKLPAAQIIIGKSNKLKPEELQSIKSLEVRIPNFAYYLPYFIQQCKIEIIKTTGQRLEYTQTGNVLTADILKAFQTLKHGDLIIFQNAKGVRDKSEVIENIDGAFVSID